MDIKLILNALKSIGLGTGIRAIQYSVNRDISNLIHKKPSPRKQNHSPENMQNYQLTTSGARINFQNAILSVEFLTHKMVRISWEPGRLPLPYTIVDHTWDKIDIVSVLDNEGVNLTSKALHISIKENGSITYKTASDELLRTDLPPQFKGDSIVLNSHLRTDEHVYGLGERASSFNLIGHSYSTWNTDPRGSYGTGNDPLYICTPVMLAVGSTGAYLMYFENTFPATINLMLFSTINFSNGALRYYFIHGSPDDLYSEYTKLTGQPAFPPRWVFGYHQSRWGYKSEAEIRDVVKGFETHNLPISAIHLDIDYMDGFRVFTTDKSRFSDLHRFVADMKEKDIHLVTIIDPGVKKDQSYSIYKDGMDKDVYCKLNNKLFYGVVWPGWAAFPDFTCPATRNWWGRQYQCFMDAGISGFWHDMNEPVSFCAWGKNTLPDNTRHNLDGRFGDHLEAHNLYGLLMNKAAYEAIQSVHPDKRVWLISRSGWAGLQRYAWNWTGDAASTWDTLRQTLITVMGLSISGHFFSGGDIGGFSGNPSAELYLRWFQLSAFFPFFRTHSAIGTDQREPWGFGEPYTSIVRKYLRLRYQLIPYIYSLAWLSHQQGVPLIRPIFWDNLACSKLLDVDDHFTLGDKILIAPVVQPDCESREVVLPPGNWYDFWNDTIYTGIATVTIPVNLERIPIFIKAGSIIPREVSDGNLELHIYPNDYFHASGMVYSDPGDGFDKWRVDHYDFFGVEGEMIINHMITDNYFNLHKNIEFVLHGPAIKNIKFNEKRVNFRHASGSDL